MSEIEPSSATPPTGDMPAADFREYGHQLVDWIADYFASSDEIRVTPKVEPGFLREALPEAAPAEGEAMVDILADVDRFIMPGMTHWKIGRAHV